MNRDLLLRAVAILAVCGALAAVGRSEPRASYRDPDLSLHQRVIRMMHDRNPGRNLNRDTLEDEIAGYYEGLLAGRPVTVLGRSRDSEAYRFRGDFLYYESRPHLDVADYNDPLLRHVTNSHGMPDIEYPLERQPASWRLAIIGDSVTRGQGAPFGASFEALLEEYLNDQHVRNGVDRFEVLNFSNTGYRLTQLVDVALEKVPAFKPDVYVLCLTRLAVARKWGDHVAQLLWDGIDLKYAYLRDLAVAARLDKRDTPATMDAKLAPHRLPAIRWAVTEIRENARKQGAELVVVLVPTANESRALDAAFSGVREVLTELGVPVIDLLDTFEDVTEVDDYRVEEGNVHPNEAGHRLIFQRLTQEIQKGGAPVQFVLGPAATEVHPKAEGSALTMR